MHLGGRGLSSRTGLPLLLRARSRAQGRSEYLPPRLPGDASGISWTSPAPPVTTLRREVSSPQRGPPSPSRWIIRMRVWWSCPHRAGPSRQRRSASPRLGKSKTWSRRRRGQRLKRGNRATRNRLKEAAWKKRGAGLWTLLQNHRRLSCGFPGETVSTRLWHAFSAIKLGDCYGQKVKKLVCVDDAVEPEIRGFYGQMDQQGTNPLRESRMLLASRKAKNRKNQGGKGGMGRNKGGGLVLTGGHSRIPSQTVSAVSGALLNSENAFVPIEDKSITGVN